MSSSSSSSSSSCVALFFCHSPLHVWQILFGVKEARMLNPVRVAPLVTTMCLVPHSFGVCFEYGQRQPCVANLWVEQYRQGGSIIRSVLGRSAIPPHRLAPTEQSEGWSLMIQVAHSSYPHPRFRQRLLPPMSHQTPTCLVLLLPLPANVAPQNL